VTILLEHRDKEGRSHFDIIPVPVDSDVVQFLVFVVVEA